MLADGCEAAVRAENPASVEEMTKIVEGIIMDRASSGELDESGLTVHEINVTRDTFVRMFQGVLHRRIKYPKEETEQPAVPPTTPAVETRRRHGLRDVLTRLGL
jgi:membrane-associated HD superfamily phosphohydrolase